MSRRRVLWVELLTLTVTISGWSLSASNELYAGEKQGSLPLQFQFQIVHAFGGAGDGIAAGGGMVMDSQGNLYGVTGAGGTDDMGTVYELTPTGNGQWTETILHSFSGGSSDGFEPIGMVMDGAGNLYGTTALGGPENNPLCSNGCGTVFELSPGADGEWKETIVWSFCSLPNCADGDEPLQPPTLGPGGSLYGVAGVTAFQLTPGSGGWTLNVLYTFCDQVGCNPTGPLTLDGKGNLYGAAGNGIQKGDYGLVFALHQEPHAQWNEVVLYDFLGGGNGNCPQGGLTFRDSGLYGVTMAGGSNCVNVGGCGAVFELTRGSDNRINEQVLWSFGGDGGAQGVTPDFGVVFNRQGDLFGVTLGGGESGGYGLVYGMKQQQNGNWAFAVLHAFNGSDGVEPDGPLLIDSEGDLFGTTGGGGSIGGGVAFELSPVKQAN